MDRVITDKSFLLNMLHDERITVWHISMYSALVHYWAKGNYQNPASITRREIMKLAHIHALATYHKCMKELVAFGYIGYVPSYNPFTGSLVYFN